MRPLCGGAGTSGVSGVGGGGVGGGDSSAYPKYDNMGRRITASGGLPDENETLFNEAEEQRAHDEENESSSPDQSTEQTVGGEFVSL